MGDDSTKAASVFLGQGAKGKKSASPGVFYTARDGSAVAKLSYPGYFTGALYAGTIGGERVLVKRCGNSPCIHGTQRCQRMGRMVLAAKTVKQWMTLSLTW